MRPRFGERVCRFAQPARPSQNDGPPRNKSQSITISGISSFIIAFSLYREFSKYSTFFLRSAMECKGSIEASARNRESMEVRFMPTYKMATILLLAFALIVDVYVIISQGFSVIALIFIIVALASLIAILSGKLG